MFLDNFVFKLTILSVAPILFFPQPQHYQPLSLLARFLLHILNAWR